VSSLRHDDGELVEIYIGGERTGGLYLTLQVQHLDRLITQLRAVRGAVTGSSQPVPPTQAVPAESPRLRAPYAGDFGAGPNVCVAVPGSSEVSCLVHEDGAFTEVRIGGGGSGGVFVTLPTAGLEHLVEELEAVRGCAVDPGGHYLGSRWAPPAAERATDAAQPVLMAAPAPPRADGPGDRP
jgi:hypothetical protein